MPNTNETGHAKNVANLEELIAFIESYGDKYNPSRDDIKTPALKALLQNGKDAIHAVNLLLPPYSNAVAARNVAFSPVEKLSTRILNAVKATDTASQVDDNAKTIVRKLQGVRATPKLTEEQKKELTDAGKSAKEISASQQSFDNMLDNLDKLIQLLQSIPQYTPNEEDLKVEALQALYDDLSAKHAAVKIALAPLSNARIARDEVLYKPLAGIVDIAFDTKTYIKSAFGASSPQYKQVSGLIFRSA